MSAHYQLGTVFEVSWFKHVLVDRKCYGAKEPSVDISFKSARPNSILCRQKQGLIHYCGGPLMSDHECLGFLLHMIWIWELSFWRVFLNISSVFIFTLNSENSIAEMSLPTTKPSCTSCFMKQTNKSGMSCVWELILKGHELFMQEDRVDKWSRRVTIWERNLVCTVMVFVTRNFWINKS